MELGYWPVKGLGEPIRMLLSYLNIQYEEKNPTSL